MNQVIILQTKQNLNIKEFLTKYQSVLTQQKGNVKVNCSAMTSGLTPEIVFMEKYYILPKIRNSRKIVKVTQLLLDLEFGYIIIVRWKRALRLQIALHAMQLHLHIQICHVNVFCFVRRYEVVLCSFDNKV